MKTKDGVEYAEGMTLYRIWQDRDSYRVAECKNTFIRYGEWFSHGSTQTPTPDGCVTDCYVSYDNAVDAILGDLRAELKDKIHSIEGQIADWQTAKSRRRMEVGAELHKMVLNG